MVTTRGQAARKAEESNGSRARPTHTTSLSQDELLLIYQLFSFTYFHRKSIYDKELAAQLYRFVYFLPPPDDRSKAWRYPRSWNDYNFRDTADEPMPRAKAKAHELLSRPGALAPVPMPSPPVPLPQTQSPLFSVIPAELRWRIFELAVTHEGTIILPDDVDSEKAYPPAITRVSRLIRQETLPMYFRCNQFVIDTVACYPWERVSTRDWISEWITAMDSHLHLLHHVTVRLVHRVDGFETSSRDNPSITLSHDMQRNCWSVTSSDDWSSIEDEATRVSLERDSTLILPRVLERLLDQRSRADWSASYLIWLLTDLNLLYIAEKIEKKYPPKVAWNMATNFFKWPELTQPPDMYTWYLEHGAYNRPYWIEPNSDA